MFHDRNKYLARKFELFKNLMENKTGTFTAKKNIDFPNMFQGNNKIKVQ